MTEQRYPKPNWPYSGSPALGLSAFCICPISSAFDQVEDRNDGVSYLEYGTVDNIHRVLEQHS